MPEEVAAGAETNHRSNGLFTAFRRLALVRNLTDEDQRRGGKLNAG